MFQRWRSREFRVLVLLNLRSNTLTDDGVCYALSQLGVSDLKLKNEQKQAIYAVYGGKDVVFQLASEKARAKMSVFRYFLSSSITSLVRSVIRTEVVLSSYLDLLR